MTVIARFEVIPVRDGSMSNAIAQALRALDRHPVSYRTTATDTIIEAESVDQVFAAVRAAHQAIPEDRVITSIEIDEDRRRPQNIDERVASVERALGHPAQRQQQPRQGQPQPQQQSQRGQPQPQQSPQRQSTQQQSPQQQQSIQRQPAHQQPQPVQPGPPAQGRPGHPTR